MQANVGPIENAPMKDTIYKRNNKIMKVSTIKRKTKLCRPYVATMQIQGTVSTSMSGSAWSVNNAIIIQYNS